MNLADEIEAGNGTDEAVALALGWVNHGPMPGGKAMWRVDPWPDRRTIGLFAPPAFLTDLNALAAECERRSAEWVVGHGEGGTLAAVAIGDAEATSEQATTPTRALCAALVRAAGETR